MQAPRADRSWSPMPVKGGSPYEEAIIGTPPIIIDSRPSPSRFNPAIAMAIAGGVCCIVFITVFGMMFVMAALMGRPFAGLYGQI